MATTFTSDSGVKKIGTGLEAGTWGTSTNENWERITALIGGSVSIDVINMPTGSPQSATLDGTTKAQWVTLDASDIGQGGSEGRTKAVEFTATGTVTGDITVEVYGQDISTKVDKVMFVWNNFSQDFNLVMQSGGTASPSVTIPQGSMAVVAFRATTDGGFTVGAHNLLDKAVASKLIMPTGSDGIEFQGTVGTIDIPTSTSPALNIKDSTASVNYIRIDTTAGEIRLSGPSNVTVLDISSGGDNTSIIEIDDNQSASFKITDNTGDTLINADTTTNTKVVSIGESGGTDDKEVDLVIYGNINTSPQDTTLFIKDNDGNSFRFAEGANVYLTLDTLDTEERIDSLKTVTAPDIHLTGTDGYILGAEVTDAAGYSTGYGFRNNSGSMELKATTNETWGMIYGASNLSGDGVYFKSGANLAKGTGTLGTGNSYSSEAHGLSRVPRVVIAKMVCITNDNGYVVGDELHPSSFVYTDISNNDGDFSMSFGANATNVFYSTPSGIMYVCNKSSGSRGSINKASWDIYIEAWE